MSDPTGTIVPFSNGEFDLELIPEGDSFKVAAPGLARSLGMRDAYRLLEAIPDDEKGYTLSCTPGGEQNIGVVNEAGFYRAIGQRQSARIANPEIRSRVERFQSWVYGTVLPEIRKTGSYGTPAFDPASLSRQEILRLALNAEEERLALEVKNQELAPKAEAYDDFLDATGKYNVGAVAKMLGSSQNKLFRELRNAGVLIGKGAMRNTPYQKYMHHFEVLPHNYEKSDGTQGTSYTTYVQPSGIAFIQRKLGLLAIDPLPSSDAAVA